MLVQQVLEFISQTNGKIFAIKFVKRSDGSIREMVCRTGVTAHIKGTGKPINWKRHDLVSVFDMQAKEYRSIPVEGIFEVKVAGSWEEVQQIPRWSVFNDEGTIKVMDVSTGKLGTIELTEEELKKPMPYSLHSKDYERVAPCSE